MKYLKHKTTEHTELKDNSFELGELCCFYSHFIREKTEVQSVG